ncbi:hypothetical protein Tco_0132596 [Tanacetum coccineum]
MLKNLRIVSSGVKPSSRWLPIWESATRRPRAKVLLSQNPRSPSLPKLSRQDRDRDMAVDEVVSNNSKPPGFENFIKENKACSRLSSTSRAGKCSTSFANYSRKDLKGFSFIDEMNRMIEVGGDFGYDVKGVKNLLGD